MKKQFEGVSIDIEMAKENLFLGDWGERNDEQIRNAVDAYLERVENLVIAAFPGANVSLSTQMVEGENNVIVDTGDEYEACGMTGNDIEGSVRNIFAKADLYGD